MAANRDGSWELVDGVQRLSTLVQFAGTPVAKGKLKLSEPLLLEGLQRVCPLEGGIDAWLADNFPFVTESLVKNPLSSEKCCVIVIDNPIVRHELAGDRRRT